jgi:hypothetical protein
MDVIHDNSRRQLMQISAVVGEENLPDYVQHYNVPDEKNASSLPDELFADPGKRLYPVDSKGATWLSAAYCAMNKGAEYTMLDIKRAADAWGITEDVDKVIQEIEAAQGNIKAATDDDSNYGWIIYNRNGDVVRRRYPMFDSNGVQKAAAFFDENRRHYPHELRKQLATNILTKAAQYGVGLDVLPDSIQREAGHGIPRRTVIMRELNERAQLAKDAEFSVLMANVTRLIGNAGEGEVLDSMDKLAETIDAFDQAEGLVRYYGTKITYPADFLCSVTMKEAQDFVDKNVTLRRLTFDVEKLAVDVPAEVFHTVIGDVDVSDAEKLAAVLRDLPAADKAAVEDHLVAMYG